MTNPFRAKPLTRARISWAIAVGVIADGIQFAAGPLGWVGFDQTVDVIAMIATSLLIGFHPLLLPTFIVELVPLVDLMPTWTGCIGAVILMRRKSQPPIPPVVTAEPKTTPEAAPKKLPGEAGAVIDV